MSLKVSRAREQVGQWMVAAVATAFVTSMGLMAYAKYIDDKYAALPGDPPRAAHHTPAQQPEPEANIETVSHTQGGATQAGNTDTTHSKPAKATGRGAAIGTEAN